MIIIFDCNVSLPYSAVKSYVTKELNYLLLGVNGSQNTLKSYSSNIYMKIAKRIVFFSEIRLII